MAGQLGGQARGRAVGHLIFLCVAGQAAVQAGGLMPTMLPSALGGAALGVLGWRRLAGRRGGPLPRPKWPAGQKQGQAAGQPASRQNQMGRDSFLL